MNLIALPRAGIEGNLSFRDGPPSVAICVAYPNGRLHKPHPDAGFKAILHLRFSDCDGEGAWCFPDRKDPESVAVPMTRGQAVDVLDFVEKWKDSVETIYCACYGGVSRSRGLLAGLAAVYGWDDLELYSFGHPNAWVKTLLLREAAARRKL